MTLRSIRFCRERPGNRPQIGSDGDFVRAEGYDKLVLGQAVRINFLRPPKLRLNSAQIFGGRKFAYLSQLQKLQQIPIKH